MKILVVGGGLGGMVLGYRLLKKGHTVTIFEKNDHLGGLASGFELYGTHLEQAYHHIFKTDTSIIELAKELGISNDLVWNKSSVAFVHNQKIQPWNGPVDLIKYEGLGLVDKIRLAAVALLMQKDSNWGKYHKISAWEFMKRFCGQNVFENIWEPLLVGKFHKYAKKVSMAWLWARLNTRTNSKKDGVEMLGYFDGGFNILIKKLELEIKKMGGKIELNKIIDKLPRKNYDKIVFTGSNGAFASLIKNETETEPGYLFNLKKINYLGAICMVFSSKQSLSKYYWHNINNKDAPFLAFIQHTNFVHSENYEGKHIYYAGVYTPDLEQDVEEKWFKYIKVIFPDFDKKLVDKTWVFKLKNAQHVVECGYTPLPYKTPLKNIYLMNFSQVFPEDRGTNFAVAEANKVAKML